MVPGGNQDPVRDGSPDAETEDKVQGLFADICSPSSFDQADMVVPLCAWPMDNCLEEPQQSWPLAQSHAARVCAPLSMGQTNIGLGHTPPQFLCHLLARPDSVWRVLAEILGVP